MIKQFDAQGSDSEEESEEGEQEQEKAESMEEQKEPDPESEEITTGTESEQASEAETESEKETEEERHTKRRNTIVGPPAQVKTATILAVLPHQAEKSDQGSALKPQSAALATKPTPATNANPPLAPSEDSESDAYLTDSTEARDAGVSASEESSTPAHTEDEESESD